MIESTLGTVTSGQHSIPFESTQVSIYLKISYLSWCGGTRPVSLISALWSRLTSPAFRRKPAISISISPQDSTYGQLLLFPATFSFPLLIPFASRSLCVYGFPSPPLAHRFSRIRAVLSSVALFALRPACGVLNLETCVHTTMTTKTTTTTRSLRGRGCKKINEEQRQQQSLL